MKKIAIVADKLFPLDSDGGTAFAIHEWSLFLADLGYEVDVVFFRKDLRQDQLLNLGQLQFNVVVCDRFSPFLKFIFEKRRFDIVFVNSAFKKFEILTLCLRFISTQFYWLGHGSLDTRLTTSFKKRIYINIWGKFFSLFINGYISNSGGEHDNLPVWLQKRSFVIENLLPKFTLEYERLLISNAEMNLDSLNLINQFNEYFLIFGRIDRKKKIIETIIRLDEIGFFKRFNLIIAGKETTPGYAKQIKDLILVLGLDKSIIVVDRLISNVEKINYLKNSNGLLLYSDSEGLPIVLLEALCLQVPIFCSPGCNLGPYANFAYVSKLDTLELEVFNQSSSNVQFDVDLVDEGRKKLFNLINS